MGPLALTLLLLAAFTAFVALAWRKLSILRHLAPDARLDHPWQRARSVLVNGFLQSRMIRREWKPGVMHAAIFLGFLTLLVRKVELLAIGYDASATLPGTLGGVFAALKDIVEIAVLAACGYALYRRLVLKPPRLERNREALLVLGLIVAIMVTDYAFDAFRFALFANADPALAHERAFAVFGSALASAIAGLPESWLRAGYHASYWLQIAVVLFFLVIIPLGEHFHIVTALPTLFFRRSGPANAVPYIDVDKAMEQDDVQMGARTARDLTWKEGLDAFTCTECGRCKDACPAFRAGMPLSQKGVNDALKRHLVSARRSLETGGELPPLVPDVVSDATLWSCTTCGYCEAACPIELEHLPRFMRMRQQRVMIEGAFPRELRAVFSAYEVQGNPWGLPADTRGDWAAAAGVPVAASAEDVAQADYLFYVGSAQSFDPRGQKIASAFARIMRAAGVRIVVLGAREGSTGECVRRCGNEVLFQALAGSLVETLREFGVKRIVTCDPHAFNTLRNEYPALGARLEVVHHTELIAQLLNDGRLRVRRQSTRTIYHEPCYLARHNGVYEAPRDVLRAVLAHPPLEFPLHREKAMCCGAGGGRMWMEEAGTRPNMLRLAESIPLAPEAIATGCPYCALMLTDATKAMDGAGGIAVRDIAEIVADALESPPQ
ncbi:MAG: heterodisulfide reductase-related iron-sulfur binding cluster [Burkholderiales bacterium]